MVQRLVLLTLVLSLTLLWGATGLTAPEPPEAMPGATPSASKPTMLALERAYGEMPLYFIENCGQLDGQVAYYLPGSDKTLYFTAEGVTFALTGRRQTVDSRQGEEDPFLPADFSPSPDLPFSPSLSRWAVKLDFVDANPAVQPVGESSLEMVVSYFKGKPEDWHTGLRTYSRLVYRDLWPGIDLVYYGTVNQLKYEFVVHPGADPAQIRLAYRGASDVRLNAVGQLEVTTPVGSFTDDTPVAYQEIGGQRVPVKMSYELPMTDEVNPVTNSPFSFAIGDYDATRPLILDPAILLYSGFIGGNGEEQAYDIAVDNTGNAYVVGFTGSSNFPTIEGPDLIFNGGTYDVFIAKIRADGAGLVYAGFLGGTGDEEGSGVAVDNLGNAYITGYTGSTDFPVLNGPDLSFNGGTYDVFIAKINTTGTALIYSGFLGGSDSDYGLDIILDEANAVYITGRTASSNFPTVIGPDLSFNGTYDAFVTKVNAAGDSLVYSGFVGGNNDERSYSIAIDDAQNVYITGWTKSDDFPTTNGFDQVYNGLEDAFVVKVDNDGTTLAYASFLGSGGDDRGYGVAVDDAGYAYVTGYTNSPGFPTISGGMDTTHNGNYDAFVAKVHPNGSNLSYASFLGGSGNDYAYNIAIDTQGNSYVTGYTASTNFPTIGGLDATHNGGIEDVFVVKVNETGTALAYAGYIGGSSAERGTDIAIDVIGNAYVTGYTQSSDFSVVGGPDLSYNDNSDAFVAKISAIHTVSGSVVDASGDGIANVLLTTSANDSTLTDAYGYYTFTTIYSGTHVMTPTLTGIFFTPRTRTVVVTECNVSDVNFTGHFVPHSVSLGGVANGATTVAYRFTATTNPTATTPITYTWQATGQTNQTVVNGTSASAVFTWTTTGVKTVTVNAYNAGGEVTATHTITLHVPFEDGSVSITPIVNSAVAWGDYNQDHALDAVTVGYYDGTSPFARLYRNTGGGLSDSGNALTGLGFSAVAWGDYDNDNEVDLLVTGANGSSQPFTQLYHNEDGVLTEAMTLTGVYKGSAAWGDYDNDGDLDILLTGQTGSGTRIARVYRNDAGVFNDSGAALTGVYESSAAWGDYDNDGDLDILLTGADNSGNRATRLYRNGDGVFTSVSTALPDMAFSSVAWGDYDQDGDLDILMAGYIGGGGPGRVTRIYRNDGNAVFTNINAALSGVEPDAPQAVAWGDYDNDGDLDIVLTGYNQSDQVTVLIYRNDGNGQFTDIGAALTGVWYASVAWGDYDADGDLDLLLTGYDAYGGVGKLYRNNSNVPNTAPTAPQGLQAAPGISTTQFSWQAVQDSETLSPTLTYNLRVGTTPGGSDIVAPMALITDGYRLLPAFGNVQHGLTATLALTQPGVYSWAVQAVDTAFAGGAWSAEQTLRVGAPLTIALKGQRVGLRNQTYPLTATINLTAALPITYVWQTSAHTPVTHTAIFSYTDAVSFAWTTEGVHSITVTAINIAGDLTATQRITITTPPQAVTFSPPRHIVTASPTTTISVTYNQLMDLTSVTSRTFAIHGMQSGLVTGTHYLINGNTLGVTPPRPFHQGELIYAVATTHTRSITGVVPLTATT